MTTTAPVESGRLRSLLRSRPYVTHQARRTAGAWMGLFAVMAFFAIASPIFLTTANLTNVLIQSSNLLLVAGGATVVLIVGEIDLAVASIEALAGAVAAVLVIEHGFPLSVGVLAALVASGGVGLLSGLAVAMLEIPSFIVTLAMLGIASGAAYLLTGGNPILGFPAPFDESATVASQGSRSR